MSIDTDTRNLAKWLNEEPNAPIDRHALARVLAHLSTVDEAAMARLRENGAKAWAFLGDRSASDWVDEIRGNDHVGDANKKVGQDCEPIYQWRMNDGQWVDQTRSLYYSRVDAGEDKNRLRIVYAAPPKREPQGEGK